MYILVVWDYAYCIKHIIHTHTQLYAFLLCHNPVGEWKKISHGPLPSIRRTGRRRRRGRGSSHFTGIKRTAVELSLYTLQTVVQLQTSLSLSTQSLSTQSSKKW